CNIGRAVLLGTGGRGRMRSVFHYIATVRRKVRLVSHVRRACRRTSNSRSGRTVAVRGKASKVPRGGGAEGRGEARMAFHAKRMALLRGSQRSPRGTLPCLLTENAPNACKVSDGRWHDARRGRVIDQVTSPGQNANCCRRTSGLGDRWSDAIRLGCVSGLLAQSRGTRE